MHTTTTTTKRSRLTTLAAGLATGALLATAGLAGLAAPAGAMGSLHVTPHTLVWHTHPVAGGPCEGTGCTYATATIHNSTAGVETMNGASATDPFWVTFGGTCNSEDYVIPAHTSCTLQFGFAPEVANTVYTGIGTIDFTDGTVLQLGLKGRSA